jgi:hypothetical protein
MTVRVDDPTIADDAPLWRRIQNQPSWVKVLPDGNIRPSSATFLDNYTNEVSVHLARLTTRGTVLQGRLNDGLVELLAGFPRTLGHIAVCDCL